MDHTATILCVNKIVDELLESSSTSDEEEDDEIFIALFQQNIKKPDKKNSMENIILQYSDLDVSFRFKIIQFSLSNVNFSLLFKFQKYMRIKRTTAIYLMEKYATSGIRRTYKGGRQQATVEKQILSFLW